VFTRPDWQAKDVSQSNRGVPDVAGNADPETGYKVQVDGQQLVIGGTSAVAPLCAGLIALLNQKLKSRIGFINPLLYTMDESSCFRDISSGNNGAYSAGPGWDATTGLGSPVGIQIGQALQLETPQVTANKETRARS
jgi:kumamolisin